jgi:hypothetical protein
MRKLLILGAAVLAAAPLAAQPAGSDRGPRYDAQRYDAQRAYDAEREGEAWDDEDFDADERDARRGPPVIEPGQVQAMAGAVDRLLGAVMDLPIGGIAAAVDPMNRGGVHPGATVRDMATRDDPYAEQRLRAEIRGASRSAGAMTEALARVMPVLERSIEEAGREIEAAMDQADGRRPR